MSESASPAPTQSAPAKQSNVTVGQEVASKDGLPSDYVGYPMPNGKYVLVNPSQPLPAPVKQDIISKTKSVAAAATTSNTNTAALQQNQQSAEGNTGKSLIIVRQGYGVGASGNLELMWLVTRDGSVPQYFPLSSGGLTQAQAAAQADAAGQPKSEVIVAG